MSPIATLSRVSDQLRRSPVQLAEGVSAGGLNPKLLQDLAAGIESSRDAAGLGALEAIVGSQEETRDLVEYGGRRHRFKEVTEKEWLTPFGLLRVPRRYFQPDRGGQGIVPLDVRCGMEDRYMTPDLEEACALGSAMLVPREVETFLKKALPQGPSATAIQKVIKDVGGFAEENQDLVEEGMREKAPLQETGDVLVASRDGVAVPLSERGRKRGRPRERPAGEERKECPTAWREAGVGSMEAAVAELRATRGLAEVVVVCDGKASIWNVAKAAKAYEGAVFVLDFFHAVEHLSRASEAILGKKSEKGRKWYDEYRARLKEDPGGVAALVRSLRYYMQKTRWRSERRTIIRRTIAYFQNNKDRMRYAEFIARGLPIGSGPVEAACKTVVGARLKRSGMRWTREGGQRVLNLRVHHLSKRWSTFWQAYQADRMAA